MNVFPSISDLHAFTGALKSIHVQPLRLKEPFMDAASRFAHMPGTVILMSGGDLDSARYHIIAARPWLTILAYGDHVMLRAGDRELHCAADPFEALSHVLSAYAIASAHGPLPVRAGLFGYFSYDLKDFIEVLPRTVRDDTHLPHMCLFAPSIIVICDKTNNQTFVSMVHLNQNGAGTLDQTLAEFHKIMAGPPKEKKLFFSSQGKVHSSFSKEEYIQAVCRIKEYIVSGHIYQVNLSQRFETDFSGDPFGYFSALYEKAPAPFYAYIHAGDHWIVSTSPERFLLQQGQYVETRPIKGTRPRGNTPEEDLAMGQALQKSQKDDAELSMIVDLMRNDLGRVCEGGSVRVIEHKRLEAYQNVFHLVSIVAGKLMQDKTSVDLIRAAFPGGSITGCPRIRSMEIIDELEPVRRHVYTGAIGYISFHDTLNLSIAIRTATICRNRIFFSVGGGVVYDSDPEDEYHETLHKGRSLMGVLRSDSSIFEEKQYVWHNGVLKPASKAMVSVFDLGVQYGYGFFETIRVNRGNIHYLEDHIRRFYSAWDHLFKTPTPDLTWEEIIRLVIEKNRLNETTAAVKIMATYGDADSVLPKHSLMVSARPYAPRPAIETKGGLDAAVYPHPRQTPLAAHKTLNYLYYYLAGQWARSMGADEALILNPDGSVSETHTANILMIKDGCVIQPKSLAALPGIMEKQVIDCLMQWGYGFKTRVIMPDALLTADSVVLTNSLIGAVPLLRVDGRQIPCDMQLCRRVCQAVLKSKKS